jgi:hypothetical protein
LNPHGEIVVIDKGTSCKTFGELGMGFAQASPGGLFLEAHVLTAGRESLTTTEILPFRLFWA